MGKLVVFNIVSEMSSCCEVPVSSGSKLKFTKLNEPRGQCLQIGLQAYSGGSNSLPQADITLIAASFLQNSPLFRPHYYDWLSPITVSPRLTKLMPRFLSSSLSPPNFIGSHKNQVSSSKEIKPRFQMVIRIQSARESFIQFLILNVCLLNVWMLKSV